MSHEGLVTVVSTGYVAVLLLLLPFGAHRLYLLLLRWRRSGGRPPEEWSGPLPPVTVQIPVYNEANVVDRAVDAACRLDYPARLLEIQVLDDSDDETSERAARRVAAWRRRGVDVRHLRRETRKGYKAGALAEGLRRARGEFLLILDADFVAPADLVHRLLPPFSEPEVGMVQAAWSHLNQCERWLTRGQALLLDAHFAVEHEARCRAGLFFNFNGTAGMWRKAALEDAGGWECDTLTEDLDLSYRAQLAGWRGVYRDDVRVPGELPRGLRALEVQQERWARGGIQTARKLLPRVWRSDERLAVKAEATAHLLGHLVHPLTVLLALALGAAGWLGTLSGGVGVASTVPSWIHGLALSLAVLPFVVYYGAAARARSLGLAASCRRIAEAVTLGIGLGVPISAAVVAGATGRGEAVFRRTPKRGARLLKGYGVSLRPARTIARLALGLLLAGAALRQATLGFAEAVPFTLLFATAYLAAALDTFRDGTG